MSHFPDCSIRTIQFARRRKGNFWNSAIYVSPLVFNLNALNCTSTEAVDTVKMKVCVLLLLVTASEGLPSTTPLYRMNMSNILHLWNKTVAGVTLKCMGESGAKPEHVDGFFKYGMMPDDSYFKCYFLCNGVNLGVFSPTGDIYLWKWAQTFDYIDFALARMCASIPEPDPCHKVYLAIKCVYNALYNRYILY
ncbi:hypothetical protein ILUMI_03913 [Ignelater luminosus]|uniref:Uncharacterized protein n=1 Tax=Ignelater luminosus TaxID=2038154 RepID=A0A8K0DKU1_IGNLU|nr:hypothetical protein ILUMI_03913 [Ignelater luminosus]